MITPEELIQELIDFYGYEVDLSYAINYVDMVGQYAEVDSFLSDLWGAGQCYFSFVGDLVSGKPYGGLSRGVWSDFRSDRWTSVCGWCEPGASGGFKQQTAGNYGSIFPVLWIYQYRREQRGPCGRAGFRNCHGMDIIPQTTKV